MYQAAPPPMQRTTAMEPIMIPIVAPDPLGKADAMYAFYDATLVVAAVRAASSVFKVAAKVKHAASVFLVVVQSPAFYFFLVASTAFLASVSALTSLARMASASVLVLP
jgi:hypothetical protein